MHNNYKKNLLEFSKPYKRYKERRLYPNQVFDVLKRTLDFIMALFAIVLNLPLMILIGVLIKSDSKGAAIYKHKRVGLHGQQFYVYKFRSMICTNKPLDEIFTSEQMEEFKRNYKLDNDPRITRIGKFLRRTNLDELPQFFNILLGKMSFVGPRPVLQEETALYGKDRELLLSVVPGLTGYWQVNSRSCTAYKERIDMELYYIENRSVFLDIKIIIKTIVVVFFGKAESKTSY